jgi:hypothetical protein
MSPDAPDAPALDTVRCPTCRAVQEWSDTCRRCKSDLRLLRAFASASLRCRRACLEQLRSGHPRAALQAAERYHAIRADAESRRWLALAALRAGDWATAETMARRVIGGEP